MCLRISSKQSKTSNASFIVDGEKLKQITDHFIGELQKGLDGPANIPMNPTWVMGFPTGQEQGSFLALDMGGTNLRSLRDYVT